MVKQIVTQILEGFYSRPDSAGVLCPCGVLFFYVNIYTIVRKI